MINLVFACVMVLVTIALAKVMNFFFPPNYHQRIEKKYSKE